jgi:hypothetical protein
VLASPQRCEIQVNPRFAPTRTSAASNASPGSAPTIRSSGVCGRTGRPSACEEPGWCPPLAASCLWRPGRLPSWLRLRRLSLPLEIIAIAVHWYLRYGLSCRDGGRDPRQGRRRVASRQRDKRAARRAFERAIGATKSPRLRLSLIGPVCVPDRHGRAALSCMASHRAVGQQPRRGRSRPPESRLRSAEVTTNWRSRCRSAGG